ncbi:MAG TPA: hypothetical protein DCQ47_00040 [Gammaproteobacteria bacterium]|nr:hypothetical protein [Gammaproteobacteria bacterium]|tara:strand:- start:162 stop:362 length:201 start_codon:yes stop_codon:yes gene_type:complete
MGITNWKNLPAMDVVTKALIYNSSNENFESRLKTASEILEYTKTEMDAIRSWRKNYLLNLELGMPK